MSGAQRAIALVGLVLIATAVLGVIVRRRYPAWRLFLFYLLAVGVGGALPHLWPARFFTPEFSQVKETAYVALRFGMAAELAWRTFAAFPGAMATLRWVAFVILLVTLAAVLTAPVGEGYTTFMAELQPRVLNGSVWVLTAIAGLILYYRLPIGRFQKQVLLSYLPYVLVFTVFTSYFGRGGWRSGPAASYVNQLAYVALVAFWNVAIWRRDPESLRREEPNPAPA